MRFSIIMPVYNVKKYIKQCMDTVIKQTYKDYEVIIVDDGSTDGSGEICEEYKAVYPDLIKVIHTENKGLMQARRCGIKNASGDIFVFVDSDDYVEKNLLENLYESFRHYSVDMVIYGFYRFIDGKDSSKEIIKLPYKSGKILSGLEKVEFCQNFMLNHTCTNMWQKAVKRDCVDIDADYSKWNAARCEDVIQSFALLENSKTIMFLNKPLYFYRKNEGAMTAVEKPIHLRDYLTCTNVTLHYIEKWGLGCDFRKKYLSRQNIFYYNCIRNIYKCSIKEINTRKVVCDTVSQLSENDIFQEILNEKKKLLSIIPKRLRARIRFFDFFMVKKQWNAIYILIVLNTLGERR